MNSSKPLTCWFPGWWFFEDRVEPIREYELLTFLQAEGLLALCEAANYWVALFRKHFCCAIVCMQLIKS